MVLTPILIKLLLVLVIVAPYGIYALVIQFRQQAKRPRWQRMRRNFR